VKTKFVGSIENRRGQTVTVSANVGVCDKCGSLGIPLSVVVNWGSLPECLLTTDEGNELVRLLTNALDSRKHQEKP
jgi:4-hydroxy-3-methylbut-2-en-1-yl diphosphate synthase IspG/GcpE